MSLQRTPKCVMLKTATSGSGKYKLFFGHHYLKGTQCYDVGTINQSNGEIITRHYHDKAEALRVYHEYEKALTTPPKVEERDDNSARVADAFRRAIRASLGKA